MPEVVLVETAAGHQDPLALIVAGALLMRVAWWYDREAGAPAYASKKRVVLDVSATLVAAAAGMYLFGLGVLRAWA